MELNGWKIVKDSFSELDFLTNDTTFYNEDMFQASFNNYIVDCGWYGEHDGCFIKVLIRDGNWEEPMVEIVLTRPDMVKWSIEVCKEYLRKLQ